MKSLDSYFSHQRGSDIYKTKSDNPFSWSRRTCLAGVGTLIGASAALGSTGVSVVKPGKSRRRPSLIVGECNALVSTTVGRVRGYTRNGIQIFKGIPYAESTAGANRFVPPVKCKPWLGVRNCFSYGPMSPQPSQTVTQGDEMAFLLQPNPGVQDEDCLRINVWTPVPNASGTRPVMVWLHGGGFTTGSGNELPAYDGENLARRGDVVVVSLNHRLGALGFMDLSHYSEQYAASGNVGMLDIVAALEWVRDNIAEFGGNPRCVTIFGESGGGAKVSFLMAMPAARGLFHRAIVQSGSYLRRARTSKLAQQLTDETLEELGLNGARLADLQQVPFIHLVSASRKVIERQPEVRFLPDYRRWTLSLAWGWCPVKDGNVLPQHPFDPQSPSISADVPMLVGTTLNEIDPNIDHPDRDAMTYAELLKKVSVDFGDRAAEVIAVFQKRASQARPSEIWSRIASAPIRGLAIEQCTRKAALRGAPVWLYWFTWQTPVLDGRPGAFHGSELPFVFNNAERCDQATGGGDEAIELAHRVSDAWVQFARTGNPNHAGLLQWPAFTPHRMSTMIFDNSCWLQNAPDRQEQAVVLSG